MHDVINRNFRDKYFNPFNPTYEVAFNAMLAYEKNCIAKYDYLDNRPSKIPIKGERIGDFAYSYGTTVKEMRNCEMQVEYTLKHLH